MLACALAATIAGCGGGDDGTIPSDKSDELLTQLDAIQNDVEAGNCEVAQEHATAFANSVSQLPEDVDPKVRQGLIEASSQVLDLTSEPGQCEQTTGATGPSGAVDTSTEEEPTSTEEEPTSTEEEPTEPEQSQGQAEGNETNQGNSPLEVPGDNAPGGNGGRGGNSSGGIEPNKAVTR